MKIACVQELDVSPGKHDAISRHLDEAFADNTRRPGDRSFFVHPPHMRVMCLIDEVIVGHLAIYLRTVRINEMHAVTAAFGDIAVAKAHRRKGIAGGLIEKALTITEEAELDFAWLAGDEPIYAQAAFFATDNVVTRVCWETGETISSSDHDMMVHDLDGWDWDLKARVNLLGPML